MQEMAEQSAIWSIMSCITPSRPILNFLFILESSGESEKRMAWDWNTGIVLTIESISTDIFYLTIECTY